MARRTTAYRARSGFNYSLEKNSTTAVARSERIKQVAAIFAIDVVAFAYPVMSNHYPIVVRIGREFVTTA